MFAKPKAVKLSDGSPVSTVLTTRGALTKPTPATKVVRPTQTGIKKPA